MRCKLLLVLPFISTNVAQKTRDLPHEHVGTTFKLETKITRPDVGISCRLMTPTLEHPRIMMPAFKPEADFIIDPHTRA